MTGRRLGGGDVSESESSDKDADRVRLRDGRAERELEAPLAEGAFELDAPLDGLVPAFAF